MEWIRASAKYAQVVAEKMAANCGRVICVTHLAQLWMKYYLIIQIMKNDANQYGAFGGEVKHMYAEDRKVDAYKKSLAL